MEIKLTSKQTNILNAILQDKVLLQNELKRLSQRESELILMVAESAGVSLENLSDVVLSENKLLIKYSGVQTINSDLNELREPKN